MTVDSTTWIVGVVCLIVGWYANEAWDAFMDWLSDATGFVQSAAWDLCAILGIVALCAGGAWLWLH